jgi:thioredoxin 1
MRMSATVKISDASFEADVLKSAQPVLVDFWAEWCGPCRAIAPALEEIAKDLQGKVTVAKINIDENPATPMKYRVQGIPTLMLFKNGQVAATKVGSLPKGKLVEWINSVV